MAALWRQADLRVNRHSSSGTTQLATLSKKTAFVSLTSNMRTIHLRLPPVRTTLHSRLLRGSHAGLSAPGPDPEAAGTAPPHSCLPLAGARTQHASRAPAPAARRLVSLTDPHPEPLKEARRGWQKRRCSARRRREAAPKAVWRGAPIRPRSTTGMRLLRGMASPGRARSRQKDVQHQCPVVQTCLSESSGPS